LLGMCCCSCQLECLFTAHMESGSSPLSFGVFLPPPLSQAFPFLVAGHVLLPPSLARPGLFIYSSVRNFPPSSSVLRVPHPLCYISLLFLLLITQFLFFFFPVWGRSVQGAMLIWSRVVCGSTTYHLAHLVIRVFPSCLGVGVWWPGGPHGFSI
jgi:hypothetical protein